MDADPELISKALFGNKHFLAVLQEVARGDGVTTVREVSAALGVADPVVRSVIDRLVALEYLELLPRSGQKQYLERRTVTISNLVTNVIAAASIPEPPPTHVTPRRRRIVGR